MQLLIIILYLVPLDIKGCICLFPSADTPLHIQGDDMFTRL